MYIGEVVGCVVASVKEERLENIPLLVVQLIEKGVAQKDLADILTRECLRYMYRILFLLFVESRKELNYAPVDNPAYASAYSFESLRDLEMIPLMTDEDLNGRYIHDSITKLFRFFEKGTGTDESIGSLGNFSAAGFSISPLRGALLGEQGWKLKMISRRLLKNEQIHFIGSDAHDSQRRAPNLELCRSYVVKKMGEKYAQELFFGNPQALLKKS